MKNKYLISFLCGLFLNFSFFIHNTFAQLPALFVIAPVFYVLSKIPKRRSRYFAGLLFFGAWLIPTTYWYYLIFPWWSAFLRSVGFVTLMAFLFVIPTYLYKKRNFIQDTLIIIISWTLLTTLRIISPVTENWWIPHIAYTQWLNPLVIQIASFVGVYGMIFLILIINFLTAYFLMKKKFRFIPLLIIIICLISNSYLENVEESKEEFTLIALQYSHQGFNAQNTDIQILQQKTKEALEAVINETTIVVWPENMIKTNQDDSLKEFARDNNIYLVYNREEPNEPYPFNTVVILDPNGETILTNYKQHAAPAEKITPSKEFEHADIAHIKVSADICYDLHYPDIKERVRGIDLLLTPVDDRRYGSFLPYLHAADVVFRAAENRVNILTSSTSGPTLLVNKRGVVVVGPLRNQGILKSILPS